MEENKSPIKSIDEYILSCPKEVQEVLKNLREVIKEAAPEATEKISYQMPTFFLYGNLVHFANFKNHIGFYPTPNGIEAFNQELSKYKTSKGAIQFQKDEPLPYELISRIVKYRVVENIKKAEEKAVNKKKQ
ncbi:DUF1801 domain-containing protein [Clostridium sp. YIM B02505]|uniref:DUF1801 domain-containing protein n=1 Tax=Clostridium yunnanense TaxID=2800325 RepID=A0ABS1EVN5_9CLOT|nr:DUF1801 domain-containing protein [Clostridium yunnanense]MBK1813363.1 DUF1801 domain-containing protein [Clostridium yunnanense]